MYNEKETENNHLWSTRENIGCVVCVGISGVRKQGDKPIIGFCTSFYLDGLLYVIKVASLRF